MWIIKQYIEYLVLKGFVEFFMIPLYYHSPEALSSFVKCLVEISAMESPALRLCGSLRPLQAIKVETCGCHLVAHLGLITLDALEFLSCRSCT